MVTIFQKLSFIPRSGDKEIMYRSNLLGTYQPPGILEIPGGGAKIFDNLLGCGAKSAGNVPGVGHRA